MTELQREILTQVAAGTLTPVEAAARLEAIEAEPVPATSPAFSAAATALPPSTAPASPAGRRVKVSATFGGAEIVGDPSVAFAVADGPHHARQDGDTMVIEHAPFEEDGVFTFGHGDHRVVINGFDLQRRRLTVRMNPDLALQVNVQAGNVRVHGVRGPISGEVQAGNCVIDGFRAPLDLSVQAGNVNASGRIDGGESRIRCEMGSTKLTLERGSSVRIKTRTTLGKIAVLGEKGALGTGGRDTTLGSGAGSLDVDCTMGSVRVDVG